MDASTLKYIKLLVVLFIYFNSAALLGQSKWTQNFQIYSDTYDTIFVQFKLQENICNNDMRTNKYRFMLKGSSVDKQIPFKLDYIDCTSQNIIHEEKNISVNNYRSLGYTESLDFFFKGNLVSDYENNPQKKAINSITSSLSIGDVKKAIYFYNMNVNEFTSDSIKIEIEQKSNETALELLKSKNFNDYFKALEIYQLLLIFTQNTDYYAKINQLNDEENSMVTIKCQTLSQAAFDKNTITAWEDIYYFSERYPGECQGILDDKEFLAKAWLNKIEQEIKVSRNKANSSDYIPALEHLDSALHDIAIYSIKDYYTSSAALELNKKEAYIMDKKASLNSKISELSNSNRLDLVKYGYLKRKYGRKTFRLGVTYNLFTTSSQYSFYDFKSDFKTYTEQINLSYFTFIAFYDRYGVYFGEFNREIGLSCNVGGYLKLVNSIYLKAGYIVHENKGDTYYYLNYDSQNQYPTTFSYNTPFFAGISIISDFIHFELGYNFFNSTYTLGIGMNIWFKNKNYKYWKEKYQQEKRKVRNM